MMLISFLFLTATGCENIETYLTQAKPYTVVGAVDTPMDKGSRTGKRWFITSPAGTYEEFAQTAIRAAYELHLKNKKTDLIEVELIPDAGLVATGINYARVSFATDKKGYTNISGTDPNDIKLYTWSVWSVTKPLTEKELTLVDLWYGHMKDFPAKHVFDNLSYDKNSLVRFIADKMHIPIAEVELPYINLTEYKGLPFIK